MAVQNYAPGKIAPIPYFQNEQGTILLIPSDEEAQRFRKPMRARGYELMFADTLHQAEELQKKLQDQMRIEREIELNRDEQVTAYRREQVRKRLTNRMNSASCPVFEREFIQLWLKMRQDKHELFRKRFTSEVGHLDALEWDDPNKHIHDLHDRMK